jgi:3',5'-nucleoside bisphosphate phosphatase
LLAGVFLEYIDLHIHSSYSDGLLSPEEIVRYAREYHLRAISITDHDSIAGFAEASAAGKRYNIEVIPGIELSTRFADITVHLLGYFFDTNNSDIIEYVIQNRNIREERAKKIVARLHELGMKISFELVKLRANGGVIGRPHIADVLLEEGYVYSFRDAFEKYLGENKAAYIQKPALEPEEGIRLVHNAGGLVFIAHPAVEITDAVIMHLIALGLDGIEVYHPKHLQTDIDHYMQIVQAHDLLICGGSDCHGPRNSNDIMLGTVPVPLVHLEQMKSRLLSIKTRTLTNGAVIE